MKSLMEQNIDDYAAQLEERFKSIEVNEHHPSEMSMAVQQTSMFAILTEVLGGSRFVSLVKHDENLYTVTILDTLQQQQRKILTLKIRSLFVWPDKAEILKYSEIELKKFIAIAESYGETRASISSHYGNGESWIGSRLATVSGRRKYCSKVWNVNSASAKTATIKRYAELIGAPFLQKFVVDLFGRSVYAMLNYPEDALIAMVKSLSVQEKLAYVEFVESAMNSFIPFKGDPKNGYFVVGSLFKGFTAEGIKKRSYYNKATRMPLKTRVYPQDLVEGMKRNIQKEKQSLTQKEATND